MLMNSPVVEFDPELDNGEIELVELRGMRKVGIRVSHARRDIDIAAYQIVSPKRTGD